MNFIYEGDSNLKFLIESGMERASLVLAAQSITDKLQNMAETLAKIEAADVMPMMDSMKENFGGEVAQRFENTVSAKLRDLTEALRTARDEIGNEIIRMEASVNGEPTNDMGIGTEETPTNDMAAASPEPELGSAEPEMDDEGFTAPEGSSPEGAPTGDEGTEDFSSLFANASDNNAAGRARKESVEHDGVKALTESADPDDLVYAEFRRALKTEKNVKSAVQIVSEHFQIDTNDVIEVVLEKRTVK